MTAPTTIEALNAEFAREAEATRRLLERLPADQLDWRPHAKSFTARALSSHIVDCVAWADAIFGGDELEFDPATYRPFEAASTADLLATFDAKVADCRHLLARAGEADLQQSWRLTVLGRVFLEKPRSAVFRDISLSHMIHHRGQLSVYLRLLDVPVPGVYGPTADEPDLE